MGREPDERLSRFLDNYCAWSVQEAAREVSTDFASVRAVRGLGAVTSLRAIERIAPARQLELMVARLNQRHQKQSPQPRKSWPRSFNSCGRPFPPTPF